MGFLQNLDINLSFFPGFLRYFCGIVDTKLSFFVVFRGIFAESRTVVRTVCGQCFEVACPKDQENHCMWHLFTGIFVFRSFALGVSFVSVCSNSKCGNHVCIFSTGSACSPPPPSRCQCGWTRRCPLCFHCFDDFTQDHLSRKGVQRLVF